MLLYYYQLSFIFILYVFLEMKYCSSKENENPTPKRNTSMAIVPVGNFQGTLHNCEDAKKIGAVNCTENSANGAKYLKTSQPGDHLKAGLLRGQSVTGMALNGTDLTVDENVFEGMIHLDTFNVVISSIEKVPDFRFINDSIRNISIDSSRLTSLAGENLQNLTKLKFLGFRNNFIRYIDPDVFKGTENLIFLDVSFNRLTTVPPNLLDAMKKLKYFYAQNNSLIHVNGVFKLTQPAFIMLAFNNLTDIYSILPLDVEKVRMFVQGVTRFQQTDLNLTRCENRVHLENIKILYEIHALNLEHNLIEDTSKSFSPCYYNKLGGYNFRLRILLLSGNKIQNLKFLMRNSITVRLGVARNRIQYLTGEDFTSVDGLDCIDFTANQIKWIDAKTFQRIRTNLFCIDLSSNLIASINGSMRYLAHLKLLDLSHNFIQTFADDEFTGLNDLLRLNLQHNQIKILGNLKELRKLQLLNVTENDLQVIRPEQLPMTLNYIQMAGNPFMCNCRLLPFIEQFIGNSFLQADIRLCLRSNFGNLSENNVLEQISNVSQNCPDMCSCSCTDYGDVSFMFVNCSSKNLYDVPQFLRNSSAGMKDNEIPSSEYRLPFIIAQNINSLLNIEDRVMGINLENNNLESLDAVHLPPNLTQLYLANNKLRSLPDSILDNQLNLREVSLSGNPWVCDCSALNFKKWLILRQDIIRDINDTRCGESAKGKPGLYGITISTLTDLDLCPTNISLILATSISILSVLILALIAKLLYNKYNISIKVFLYSHGLTFVKEEDMDYDKTFDAFISFSNNDGAFVTKEIIEEIERRVPNICLCIHYRHFVPGEFIYENIIRAVRNSKKTVLILSKNFLDSEWCLMEFRTAHIQALEDKTNRIIVIKFGDLPDDINPAVKAYLDGTTHLTWGEKNFWNKFLYVLPSGASDRYPNSINIDDEEFLNFATSPV